MNKDTERNETFNNDLEINNQIQEQEIDINIVDMELNSQLEIVPFKVIEELNRLKIYVEKKYKDTDSLSDSGYKSDSQSRSSFGSRKLCFLPPTYILNKNLFIDIQKKQNNKHL